MLHLFSFACLSFIGVIYLNLLVFLKLTRSFVLPHTLYIKYECQRCQRWLSFSFVCFIVCFLLVNFSSRSFGFLEAMNNIFPILWELILRRRICEWSRLFIDPLPGTLHCLCNVQYYFPILFLIPSLRNWKLCQVRWWLFCDNLWWQICLSPST